MFENLWVLLGELQSMLIVTQQSWFIYINPSLSELLDQCLLRNNHHGPRLCRYDHHLLRSPSTQSEVVGYLGAVVVKGPSNVSTTFWTYLPPANEVCEGYVFTSVCQSFCSQGGVPAQVHTPRQLHPLTGTPPTGQVRPPLGWAGTPPRQVHPQAGTPLGRYTPSGQVHTPRQVHTHPRQVPPPSSACWDTVNKRAVRILLECILVND